MTDINATPQAEDFTALDRLHEAYHANARRKGFTDLHEQLKELVDYVRRPDGGNNPELADYIVNIEAGNELMLIVTELGEAHEQIRTSPFPIDQTYYFDEEGYPTLERVAPDGTIRKPEGYPSEMADVEIRVGDTAGRRNIRVGDEARGKAEYNAARSLRHGGKKF